MDKTQKLIALAKKHGIDVDAIVYSVCIGDIIEVIAEELEEEVQDVEHLKELISIAKRGTEYIDWSEPIKWTLIARRNRET